MYSDHTSTFEQLLEKDGAIKFHHKNLQLLAIELFKRKNNITDLTKEIFIHDKNIKVNRQTPYFRSRETRSRSGVKAQLTWQFNWMFIRIEYRECWRDDFRILGFAKSTNKFILPFYKNEKWKKFENLPYKKLTLRASSYFFNRGSILGGPRGPPLKSQDWQVLWSWNFDQW